MKRKKTIKKYKNMKNKQKIGKNQLKIIKWRKA